MSVPSGSCRNGRRPIRSTARAVHPVTDGRRDAGSRRRMPIADARRTDAVAVAVGHHRRTRPTRALARGPAQSDPPTRPPQRPTPSDPATADPPTDPPATPATPASRRSDACATGSDNPGRRPTAGLLPCAGRPPAAVWLTFRDWRPTGGRHVRRRRQRAWSSEPPTATRPPGTRSSTATRTCSGRSRAATGSTGPTPPTSSRSPGCGWWSTCPGCATRSGSAPGSRRRYGASACRSSPPRKRRGGPVDDEILAAVPDDSGPVDAQLLADERRPRAVAGVRGGCRSAASACCAS